MYLLAGGVSGRVEAPQADVEDDSYGGEEEGGEEEQVEPGLVQLPAGLGRLQAGALHQTDPHLQLALRTKAILPVL